MDRIHRVEYNRQQQLAGYKAWRQERNEGVLDNGQRCAANDKITKSNRLVRESVV